MGSAAVPNKKKMIAGLLVATAFLVASIFFVFSQNTHDRDDLRDMTGMDILQDAELIYEEQEHDSLGFSGIKSHVYRAKENVAQQYCGREKFRKVNYDSSWPDHSGPFKFLNRNEPICFFGVLEHDRYVRSVYLQGNMIIYSYEY